MYASLVNEWLADDEDMRDKLPIELSGSHLFDFCKGGIGLCKMINVAVPGTIDERAIKLKATSPWDVNYNCELCLNSARSVGIVVVNIGADDLNAGTPHLVLGLVWQIVKMHLLAGIDIKEIPELVCLLDDGETLQDLMRLPKDKILLRWLNYHLERAGSPDRATNFGPDLQNSTMLTRVLNQLAPECCDLSALAVPDHTERAKSLLSGASAMGTKHNATPPAIVNGNPKVCLAFVASLFNTRHGLEIPKDVDMAELMDDDEGDTREARTYKMWVNSLGCAQYCNDLGEDTRDGYLLCDLMSKLKPGCVDMGKVTKPPIRFPFKKVENCNRAVEAAKGLGFSLPGTGGADFVEGNTKLLLGLSWQMMRYSCVILLKELSSNGKDVSDDDIIAWANERVRSGGKSSTASSGRMGIKSFKDASLATSLYALELLHSIEERVVNWDIVSAGADYDAKKRNALYAISVARALGCRVFLLWEDIVEVRPKMLMTLFASIMATALKRGKGAE